MKKTIKTAKNLIAKPKFELGLEDLEDAKNLLKKLIVILETIDSFEIDDFEIIDEIRKEHGYKKSFGDLSIEAEATIYQSVIDILKQKIGF